MNINILGNTTWGTTLAKVLSNDKNQVNLLFINEKKLIKTSKEPSIKVGKFEIPRSKNINYIFIDEMNLNNEDTLIIAVPSPRLTDNLNLIKDKVNDTTQVISASKGFDKEGNTLSVLIKNKLEIPEENIVEIEILNEQVALALPSGSLRTRRDVMTVAMLLGLDDDQINSFLEKKVEGEGFTSFIVFKETNKGPQMQWVKVGKTDLNYV